MIGKLVTGRTWGILLACMFACDAAAARDLGYERFSDVVANVYGSGYAVLVPFFEMPDATSDPTHSAEGYPGSIWSFGIARGRKNGLIYTQQDRYCNPDQLPMPIGQNTTRLQDYLYRFELSASGDFTVTGATPQDEIFKLTALDAKYIDSLGIDIKSTKRYYLPYNLLKDSFRRAADQCGSDFAYGLDSVLAGDVTIKVYFVVGVSSQAALNIGDHIKANLHLKAQQQLGGSEDKPVLIFSEGVKAFAVRAEPLPARK
jgi:hypothetical protein